MNVLEATLEVLLALREHGRSSKSVGKDLELCNNAGKRILMGSNHVKELKGASCSTKLWTQARQRSSDLRGSI